MPREMPMSHQQLVPKLAGEVESVCVWRAPRLRLPSCLAGELSPLVRRPPNSASPCMHPRRRSKAPDPKEQVKEWKKQMRGEERKLDRQIMSELRARLPPRRAAA